MLWVKNVRRENKVKKEEKLEKKNMKKMKKNEQNSRHKASEKGGVECFGSERCGCIDLSLAFTPEPPFCYHASFN